MKIDDRRLFMVFIMALALITGACATTYNVSPTSTIYPTIQSAVKAAQSGDTINVAAGTYKENVVLDKSLTVNGVAQDKTTVNGDQKGSVFTINSNVKVALYNMTITNGKANYGGGILNYGTLNLNNVLISQNTATSGGGISNSYGTVNVNRNNSITGNTAHDGGGIFNYGTVNLDRGSPIAKNTATYGGGIDNSGTVNMYTGSSITGNTAAWGGGISSGGTVNMYTGSSITGNTATYGGGIFNSGTGTVNMYTGSSITGNTATYGGGIYNYRTVNMITGSSITGNKAITSGGGIYNYGGSVTFKDSNGKTVAIGLLYNTNTDPYGFFTPHNTPNDIYPVPMPHRGT